MALIDQWERSLLRMLKVPPEPSPPFGHPASVRVFRASRKLYYLRLIKWGVAQTVALAGLVFWIGVVAVSEHEAARMRAQKSAGSVLANLPSGRNQFVPLPLRFVPGSVFKWLWGAKAVGLLLYGVQLAASYAVVRLDYRMRWYIVTDRSLRIRSGVWNVQEATMSYANVQQVVVSQGPLERLLNLANIRVQSAGGGAGKPGEDSAGMMHAGVFQGVENAEEIRDLILEYLRRFRESGLGDPDELAQGACPSVRGAFSEEFVMEAGRELLGETRRLRKLVEGQSRS